MLEEYQKHDHINLVDVEILFNDMVFDGNWRPALDAIARAYKINSSVRSSIEGEQNIQGFFTAYLSINAYYRVGVCLFCRRMKYRPAILSILLRVILFFSPDMGKNAGGFVGYRRRLRESSQAAPWVIAGSCMKSTDFLLLLPIFYHLHKK